MRFLMIAAGYPPLRSAGLETGCQRLAHALGARGHQVLVLTQASPAMPPVEQPAPGVEVHRTLRPLALGPLWGLSYMAQVRGWMSRHRDRYDFVLGHKLWLHSSVATGVARALGKPSTTLLVNAGVYSDVAGLAALKGGRWLLARALAADAFFCLSRVSRAELAARGIPAERLYAFRYMVDLQRFTPAPARHPHEFLFIGRFHPQKNLPLLIEAFTRVHARHASARLRLIGRGESAEALRSLAAASTAADAITFQEWTDRPEEALRGALAVVSSSDAEGLSNVSVEAAACGAPMVLTDVSGAREVLDPDDALAAVPAGRFLQGTGGLLVNPRDAAALAAAMIRLYEESSLRDRLSAESRRNAEQRFGEQACVDLFLAGVDSILTARGGR